VAIENQDNFSLLFENKKTPSSEHQYFDVQKKGWGATLVEPTLPSDSLPR
jgi:hypothetical protein